MTISQERYTSVAIILHWVMAIAFFVMLGSGVTMSYLHIPQSLKFNMYQWHKSLGVILLMAFFLRVGWRLFHKPPRMPDSIHGIERFLAHAGHFGLYVFMIALPLSGWAMVSSSIYGLPTIVFGWFEWPHIPGIAANEQISNLAKTAHWLLALGFALLILGHVGAVIKHALWDKENILPRMWWTKGKTDEQVIL